jgi:Lar family restriction alleviation protein
VSELKPCPFCGGEAALNHRDGVLHPQITEWQACCPTDCQVSPSVWRSSKKAAAEAWNTRAVDAENTWLLEQIRQLKSVLNAMGPAPMTNREQTLTLSTQEDGK